MDETGTSGLLRDLRSKSPGLQYSTAKGLRDHIERLHRDLPAPTFKTLEARILRSVFELVNGSDLNAKLGGLRAIDQLIEARSAEPELKIIKFANNVSNSLRGCGDAEFLERAAQVLGHLARTNVTPNQDFVEFEVNRGLEWLQSEQTPRRLAACLVLRALSDNAHVLFSLRIRPFFERILPVLSDPSQGVREAATEALSACLQILAERHQSVYVSLYCSIYSQALDGLQHGVSEEVHGGLLTMGELLIHTGDFMLPRFNEVCDAVMRLKDHKKTVIQLTVTRLLPKLAAYCPDLFSRQYMDECVNHLMRVVRRGDRGEGFLAIGRLSIAMKACIIPPLPRIVEAIHDGMNPKTGRNRNTFCPETLICVADLVKAVGATMQPHIVALMDPMFSAGLSETLIGTLDVIRQYLPSLQSLVQDRLLLEISTVLDGKPFVPPGTRRPHGALAYSERESVDLVSYVEQDEQRRPRMGSSFGDRNEFLTSLEAADNGFGGGLEEETPELAHEGLADEQLELLLRTLGCFFAAGVGLLNFTERCVVKYLRHRNPRVREIAAHTACALIAPTPGQQLKSSGPGAEVVEGVIRLLLQVCVNDGDERVRATILREFTHRFDSMLCQSQHLDTLSLLIYDSSFDVRKLALQLLGQLAGSNPAYVLPPLRQTLISLVTELRQNTDVVGKEEATLLLTHFLQADALQRVVRPFKSAIVQSLPLTGDPRLETAALEALGELCVVMRREMIIYQDKLIPLIIKIMQDQSSVRKREVALRTLGRLVRSTGCVITPYHDFPNLMPAILSVLKSTGASEWSLRREAIRTFGSLGALDPHQESRVLARYKQRKAADEECRATATEAQMFPGDPPRRLSSGTIREGNGADGLRSTDLAGQGGGAGPLFPASFPHGSLHQGGENLQDLSSGEGKDSDAYGRAGPFRERQDQFANDPDPPAWTVLWGQSAPAAQNISRKAAWKAKPTPASADYFPTIAINALVRILGDSSLRSHHGNVIQAIMFIFKSLGLRGVQFLDKVMTRILEVAPTSDANLRESILQQLASLAAIMQHHLKRYIPRLFKLLSTYWHEHLEQILALVEELALHCQDDFMTFVPALLPLLLSSLSPASINDDRPGDHRLALLLRSTATLRPVLKDYLTLIIPALTALLDFIRDVPLDAPAPQAGASSAARSTRALKNPQLSEMQTVCALGHLCAGSAVLRFPALATRIFPCLTRILSRNQPLAPFDRSSPSNLRHLVLQLIVRMGRLLGPLRFSAFEPALSAALRIPRHQLHEVVPLYGEIVDASHGYWTKNWREQHSVGSYPEERHRTNGIDRPSTAAHTRGASVGGAGEAVRPQPHSGAANGDHGSGALSWAFVDNQDAFLELLSGHSASRDLRSRPTIPNALTGMISRSHVNQQSLQRAWDVTQRTTRDDWDEWIRRFGVTLLQESPAPALRACSELAQVYPPLARELFHGSFVSCWNELGERYQLNLIRSLEIAFRSATIPPKILQILLNLAEFMEHEVEALPIDIRVLAELAFKCHAYAKALHYKELQFQTRPEDCIDALVTINKKLNQTDAARGMLKYAQERPNSEVTVKESWLVKMGQWEEALRKYRERFENNSKDISALLGMLKCLDAIGEWDKVLELCAASWSTLTSKRKEDRKTRQKVITLGSRAALALRRWDLMDKQVAAMDLDVVEGPLYNAILKLRSGDFDACAKYIDDSRRLLDGTFTALVAESYRRAYNAMVTAQQLAEMEEIIEYKKLCLDPNRQEEAESVKQALVVKWRDRLQGCWCNVDTWQRILCIRSVIVMPQDDLDSWLQLANLCRQNGNFRLSEKILTTHLGLVLDEETLNVSPQFSSRTPGSQSQPQPARGIVNFGTPAVASAIPPAGMMSPMRLPAPGPTPGNMPSSLRITTTDPQSNAAANFSVPASANLTSSLPVLPADLGRAPGSVMMDFDMNVGFGGPGAVSTGLRTRYAYMKHLWAAGRRREALRGTELLQAEMSALHNSRKAFQTQGTSPATMGVNPRVAGRPPLHSQSQKSTTRLQRETVIGSDLELQLQCLLDLGDWSFSMLYEERGPYPETADMSNVASYFKAATELEPASYLAWHSWALTNFRMAERYTGRHLGHRSGTSGIQDATARARSPPTKLNESLSNSDFASMRQLLVTSCSGFLKAIALGTKSVSATVMQDILNFLTVWFRYGYLPEVATAVKQGIQQVAPETWLGVVPQLIARIHSSEASTRNLLHTLLSDLGTRHPQALVYPLTVASRSPSEDRKKAAEVLVHSLRVHSLTLVEQAILVGEQLIQVAVIWHEEWHQKLEEASKLYFSEGNVVGMIDMLMALHGKIRVPPQERTAMEDQFVRLYGEQLEKAYTCIQRYIHTMNDHSIPIPTTTPRQQRRRDSQDRNRVMHQATALLSRAWEVYYDVFKKITRQLPLLINLELQHLSPKLLLIARNLSLPVPGTYAVDGSAVNIKKFGSNIEVVLSKQRPRKIVMIGNDGLEYMFLLKAHEDLRQDERCMQLFGLVNALLDRDRKTNKHDLAISRYAVMPLSHQAGVVGWVQNCDTLHALIKEYRETRRILINVEHRLMTQMAPDYDKLTQLQKCEVFNAALENTTGQDLYKILWLKSTNSEKWLERRTNFSRSLAVMSMVGYILGLGDRHPSNLMLERSNGKILHVDFGDCFEVSMNRERYPERIPFRLTRMLVKAMEASGIEGNFRSTCERVMDVLRDNRDSLIAMLEAFVYDPLISWRLLGTQHNAEEAEEGEQQGQAAVQNGAGVNGAGVNGAGAAEMKQADSDADGVHATAARRGGAPARAASPQLGRSLRSALPTVPEPAKEAETDDHLESEDPVAAEARALAAAQYAQAVANLETFDSTDEGDGTAGSEEQRTPTIDEDEGHGEQSAEPQTGVRVPAPPERGGGIASANNGASTLPALSYLSTLRAQELSREGLEAAELAEAELESELMAISYPETGTLGRVFEREPPARPNFVPDDYGSDRVVVTTAGEAKFGGSGANQGGALTMGRSYKETGVGGPELAHRGGYDDNGSDGDAAEDVEYAARSRSASDSDDADDRAGDGLVGVRISRRAHDRDFGDEGHDDDDDERDDNESDDLDNDPDSAGGSLQQRSLHVRMSLMSASLTQHSTRMSFLDPMSRASSNFDHRSTRERQMSVVLGEEGILAPQEAQNEKALAVVVRVQDKLTGRDFGSPQGVDVPVQVERLIEEATSSENLCMLYVGWCPFW